jgi:uncharacterized protein
MLKGLSLECPARLILFAIAALLLCSFIIPVWAATPEPPSKPSAYVVDLANIINNETQRKLNGYLKELEEKTTAQVVILTIQSLDGDTIEGFSLKTAEKWKLGHKGKDNGLLITVALKEKKYRFEVGYGLEPILPDSMVGSIGREYLVPYFRKGDYGSGLFNAAVATAKTIASANGVELTGLPKPAGAGKKRDSFSLVSILIIIAAILGLFVLPAFLMSRNRNRSGWTGSGPGGGWYGGGGFGGGWSGGGDSGGFSGGDGGSFGGGGSSGDW